MHRKLLRAVRGDQRGDGDQAAVALGKLRPFPDIAVNEFFGVLDEGRNRWGISWRLILCFLRHLSEDAALAMLEIKAFKPI